ncbi:MAG: aspartyl/asparaginyl beta-hydroxylase domain-containing protein [Alphaproteobacteria bacterium]|nr:aspartyl/asparaginyl beta-hydroxylase domain-containing protein [Alphaproteobacteria bacterium]
MGRMMDMVIGGSRAIYDLWIDTPPVLDTETYFPGAKMLETDWMDIREEAAVFLGCLDRVPKLHDIVDRQEDLSDHDKIAWKYVSLRAFGQDHAANQALCPKTARLIRALPEVVNAGFSILDPKKHVLAHRGPYGGLLRYHLGLIVPLDDRGQGLGVLRVGDTDNRVKEGQGLLFDDLCEHEAWNHGDTPRVVLIVDIPRPGLPMALRALDRLLMAIIAQSPKLREFLDKSEIEVNKEDRPIAESGSVQRV